MISGGVLPTAANLRGWFEAGAVCVGMGAKLISAETMEKQQYAELETAVRRVLETIRAIKPLG